VNDHQAEPIRGLPEHLPAGEAILWQGGPRWYALIHSIFHLRLILLYFALLASWHVAESVHDGASWAAALSQSAWILPGALITSALLVLIALWIDRTTVYTITTRRVVLRYGMAIPWNLNLPFSAIESASFRRQGRRTGNISLVLAGPDRLSYFHLWPHVRPWHLSPAQPTLRCIDNAAEVAALLGKALTDAAAADAAAASDAETAAPPAPASGR